MQNLVEHILASQPQPVAERLEDTFKNLPDSYVPVEEGLAQNIATGVIAAGLLAGSPSAALAKKPADTRVQMTNAEMSIDKEKLLGAIKHVESSDGVDKRDRFEPGVEGQLRKRFDKLGKNTQDAIRKFGFKRVATSYGPWQILASTAYDLGFKGAPEDLRAEATSKGVVEDYVTNLIFSRRTSKIEDVVSAYNAGLGNIGKNPTYVAKVLKYYKQEA